MTTEATTVRAGQGKKDRHVDSSASSVRVPARSWRRAAQAGPLFHPIDRAGPSRHLRRPTTQAVLSIVQGRAAQAGCGAQPSARPPASVYPT